jgi:hypothetical protein
MASGGKSQAENPTHLQNLVFPLTNNPMLGFGDACSKRWADGTVGCKNLAGVESLAQHTMQRHTEEDSRNI